MTPDLNRICERFSHLVAREEAKRAYSVSDRRYGQPSKQLLDLYDDKYHSNFVSNVMATIADEMHRRLRNESEMNNFLDRLSAEDDECTISPIHLLGLNTLDKTKPSQYALTFGNNTASYSHSTPTTQEILQGITQVESQIRQERSEEENRKRDLLKNMYKDDESKSNDPYKLNTILEKIPLTRVTHKLSARFSKLVSFAQVIRVCKEMIGGHLSPEVIGEATLLLTSSHEPRIREIIEKECLTIAENWTRRGQTFVQSLYEIMDNDGLTIEKNEDEGYNGYHLNFGPHIASYSTQIVRTMDITEVIDAARRKYHQ
ncbi:hypothetical protein V865_002134 [Kwoniella europaea PYCC6329]|uniref:Uncharacterized protein n=1 Tax=Kwoniella europaea PYCC6329 TaxID=1423913 RepID=A0AAX4KDI1_9TREE